MSLGYTARTIACVSAFAFHPWIVPASAETDFNAGAVMSKMNGDQRVSYISGVIEGLAYARYAKDNKDLQGDKKTTAGMECIYDWFYKNKDTLGLIEAAFGRYPDYPPGVIVASLKKKVCGD